jgi:hypothetical protein
MGHGKINRIPVSADVLIESKHKGGILMKQPAGLRKIRAAGLAVLLFAAEGCVHPPRFTLIVPGRCARITVQSFTRPCTQMKDGKMLCDGVVVNATCSEKVPTPPK